MSKRVGIAKPGAANGRVGDNSEEKLSAALWLCQALTVSLHIILEFVSGISRVHYNTSGWQAVMHPRD